MRLGVDATCWANERGYGRFTREIVSAMVAKAPEITFVCFLDDESAERFRIDAVNVEKIVVPVARSASQAASAAGNRSPIDMLKMSAAVARCRLDCFFSPSVYTYFPLPPGLPAVVTIHDVIAERFPALTMPSRRARLFWNAKVRLAIRQARRILTVSSYAADDISRVYGIRRDSMAIALEAPADEYRGALAPEDVRKAAQRYGLTVGVGWFSYVGGFNPHKNVKTIVEAHAALAREIGALAPHLLLVGTIDRDVFHSDQAGIRRCIKAAGTEALVHWTGFVSDPDLALLHAGAIALVMPSECEGFGLPAVEAAACGTPVIATIESPLPELLEGGGIFVRPGDVGGLLDAMRTLTLNLGQRDALGRVARERTRSLTWDRGASACLSVIRDVHGGRRPR